MNINNYYTYRLSNNYSCNNLTAFKSAKDISLLYVLKNHSKYLPESVRNEIINRLKSGEKELPLWQLHEEIYKPLMEATSLSEVKKRYPEFKDVLEMTVLENNRSKVVDAVLKIMPLEDFTLEYLKKIYAPKNQESIVRDFGFTNRSILDWLNCKLNIKKLAGNYLNLLRMSKEEENNRIAECSRNAIYANPELQKTRLAIANLRNKTPESRNKQRESMKKHYKNHPEEREKVGLITKRTWDKCPEIKEALSAYTLQCPSYVKMVLVKRSKKMKLTEEERRTIQGFYANFWNSNPEFHKIYQARREEAIAELKAERKITLKKDKN